MTAAATTPTTVVREIVVDAPPERAFAFFVGQFDRIKPRDHNLLSRRSSRPSSSLARAARSTTGPRTARYAAGRAC